MKKDLPERGAIIQRDKETFAVAPHIPGGIAEPSLLRKIADVAERYEAKSLKLTSAQRIAIIGLPEEKSTASGKNWERSRERPSVFASVRSRSVPAPTTASAASRIRSALAWR